jgi:hypothetical protein
MYSAENKTFDDRSKETDRYRQNLLRLIEEEDGGNISKTHNDDDEWWHWAGDASRSPLLIAEGAEAKLAHTNAFAC